MVTITRNPAIRDGTATRTLTRDVAGAARDAAVRVSGALAGVAVLKIVMILAALTRTEPYPPLHFLPLFAASLALSVLAVALVLARSRWFALATAAVIAESLLAVGPQKLYPGESDFFAQTPAVYPVIVVGSLLLVVLALATRDLLRVWRTEGVA